MDIRNQGAGDYIRRYLQNIYQELKTFAIFFLKNSNVSLLDMINYHFPFPNPEDFNKFPVNLTRIRRFGLDFEDFDEIHETLSL